MSYSSIKDYTQYFPCFRQLLFLLQLCPAANLKSHRDSRSVMKYMLSSLTCNFWFLKNWHFLIWGFGFGGFFFFLSQ